MLSMDPAKSKLSDEETDWVWLSALEETLKTFVNYSQYNKNSIYYRVSYLIKNEYILKIHEH